MPEKPNRAYGQQLAHSRDGIGAQHGADAVYRQIAKVLAGLGLGEYCVTHGGHEAGFVNQGAPVVLVGQAQRLLVVVKPVRRQLQGAPSVEAGGACVCNLHFLRLGDRAVPHGPFGLEEGEIAHGMFNAASCARKSVKSV